MTQTNCHNCGAPITGSTCEYCGTRFNIRVAEEPVTFSISISEMNAALVSAGILTFNEARRRVGLG